MHRVTVSPDCQSRCRVSGVQEFEFHGVKRGRPEQNQTFEVSSSDTRSDLQFIDEVKDIRPSIPRNIE